MKTAIKHFEALPIPHREEAIKNFNNPKVKTCHGNKKFKTAHDALNGALDWSWATHDFDYWYNLHKNLEVGEIKAKY